MKRNTFLAALANLFACGLGYIYVGKPKRFILPFAIYIIAGSTLLFSGMIAKHFLFYIIAFIIPIAFYIFIIVDVILISRRENNYQLKSYNKWYLYILYIIALISIKEFVILNKSIYDPTNFGKPFSIMTENMMPVLTAGDRVMCDKNAYNHSPPQINDIVAIQVGDKNAIRRIISLDNDHFIIGADNKDIESPFIVPKEVPAEDIVCKTTYIYYSSNLERIGKRIE